MAALVLIARAHLLVLITLVHTIAVVTRRRTRDLATARAIGFTRRQCAYVIATTAGTIAVVSLLFALPLGLVVGRGLWRLVAEGASVLGDAAYPVGMLLTIVPLSLATAMVAGAIASRTVLRGTTSRALRAE